MTGIQTDSITFTTQTVVTQIASDDEYHYGFNGQMKVNEMAGKGNWNTAMFWEYCTRTGTRKNLDPKSSFSWSSYSAFSDNPIRLFDLLGDTP
ncbi:MAG: hypothetical protein H7257_03095 [Taibaiella sp.]|nr:hypothetical protein [Taibaiella sp.]